MWTSLYYQLALLLLFRPFSKLRFIGSKITPWEVCSQAADAIQSLVSSYAKLYSLRRTPTFVPYFTFASATTRLDISSISTRLDSSKSSTYQPDSERPDIRDALKLDIDHLTEMAPYHSFATHALQKLHCRAHEWNLHRGTKKNMALLDDSAEAHNVCVDVSPQNIISRCPMCNAAAKNAVFAERIETVACSRELLLPTLFQLRENIILPQEPELEKGGFAVL